MRLIPRSGWWRPAGNLAGVETITPEQALAWLLCPGPGQRELEEREVAWLEYLMESGRYSTLHDMAPVEIRAGKLVNGQHRMLAIVRYGRAVKVKVRRLA